ncbi:MAG: carbohydrate ABC transporter substrate-binding protein, partial [Lachnospiraceae bacterium]|nr:carbohydrate ABC transporter substrate-binding protein [Lachnospiraceae bacterium]
MGKKSMFARAAALIMAAAVGIAAAGCGAKEQLENAAGTQTGITEEIQSDAGQSDAAGDGGMGRYVETAVYEGKGFSDMVQPQTVSDGQILFLNCLTRQKVVSDDGG